jgi:hypothetical protein
MLVEKHGKGWLTGIIAVAILGSAVEQPFDWNPAGPTPSVRPRSCRNTITDIANAYRAGANNAISNDSPIAYPFPLHRCHLSLAISLYMRMSITVQ